MYCTGRDVSRRVARVVVLALVVTLAVLFLSQGGCATVKPYVTGPCASVSDADALKALPDVTALVVCEVNGGDCTALDAYVAADGVADAANLKACAASKVGK